MESGELHFGEKNHIAKKITSSKTYVSKRYRIQVLSPPLYSGGSAVWRVVNCTRGENHIAKKITSSKTYVQKGTESGTVTPPLYFRRFRYFWNCKGGGSDFRKYKGGVLFLEKSAKQMYLKKGQKTFTASRRWFSIILY